MKQSLELQEIKVRLTRLEENQTKFNQSLTMLEGNQKNFATKSMIKSVYQLISKMRLDMATKEDLRIVKADIVKLERRLDEHIADHNN